MEEFTLRELNIIATALGAYADLAERAGKWDLADEIQDLADRFLLAIEERRGR